MHQICRMLSVRLNQPSLRGQPCQVALELLSIIARRDNIHSLAVVKPRELVKYRFKGALRVGSANVKSGYARDSIHRTPSGSASGSASGRASGRASGSPSGSPSTCHAGELATWQPNHHLHSPASVLPYSVPQTSACSKWIWRWLIAESFICQSMYTSPTYWPPPIH